VTANDDDGALRDEVEMLRRSLEDARAEHARGDLDDDVLARIEARDGPRLAAAVERLAALDEASDVPAEPRASAGRRGRTLLIALVAGLAALGVTLAVVQPFSGAKEPPLSGHDKVVLLLAAAEVEVTHGRTLRALTIYDAVLRLDPMNPEALAESGWLRYEHALSSAHPAEVARAEVQLRDATRLVPREAAAHLYYGIVLWQQHHARRGALAQFWRAASLPESPVEQTLTAQFIALVQHAG
jgi:hypothetical protein